MMRLVVILALLALMLWSPAAAERDNRVSANLDAVTGLDSNPQVSGLNLGQLGGKNYFTWGLYPAIRVDSRGEASLFSLNYAFGLNRVENTDLDYNSESHTAGVNWTLDTERVSFSLTDSFRRSPDFSTFSFFQGIVFTPEGIFFDYDTVALRRNSYNNNFGANLDYRIGARSLLVFGGGHTFRDYGEADPRFSRRLPNQEQARANFAFRREMGPQSSLEAGYRFNYFMYETGTYQDSRNQDLFLGFNQGFGPTVRLTISAGPSYLEQIGGDLKVWGYNASVNITKSFEKEFISFYYRHDNGGNTGIGGISKTDRVGFGFTQIFARWFTVNLGASFYDTKRVLDNIVDLRGIQANLALNFQIFRNLILNLGASYHDQEEDYAAGEPGFPLANNLDRKRIYASLRFDLPEFWRF